MFVEDNLRKNRKMKENNFYKLLEKICKDFDIKDSKKTIKEFIEKM